MASTTTTSFDAALKQLYRDSRLQKITYRKRPLLGTLPKFENFVGRNMPVVLLYQNPQGRSATFATAQDNATAIGVEDFLLTRASNYQVSTISGEVVEATRGDAGAFLSALKAKIDCSFNNLADDIETSLFRTRDGWRATIAAPSVANPMVLTLTYPDEITNFEVGMVLVADDTITGASVRTTPASITVAAINRSTGALTSGYDNSGGATNWASGDYLFVSGDQASALKIAGLSDWFPSAALYATAVAASFYGVTRSTDTRLAGSYHNGATQPLEESAIDMASKISREDGSPDLYFIHHAQLRRLVKELGAKKEYSQVMSNPGRDRTAFVSYEGVKIDTDSGPVNVVAANKCPVLSGFMLTTWVNEYATLGPATKFLMEDNLKILRQSDADGYEVRMGSRGNFNSKAPIWNGHVTLPAP